MPSNYTGNPVAVQAPSAAPALTAYPIGSIPSNGDSLNAESVAQDFKVALDNIAYLIDRQRDQIFGTGVDGSPIFSGTNDLTGMKYFTEFVLTSATMRTNGWPVIARNSITIQNGTASITCDGVNVSTAARGIYPGTPDGPHGHCCPSAGSAAALSWSTYNIYGLGGAGGRGGGTGTSGGTVIPPGSSYKSYPYRFHAGQSVLGANSNSYLGPQFDAVRGGGAGTPGDGVGGSAGGGGGAAGGLIVLIAPVINFLPVGGLTLSANGGNGGAGAGGNACGGGGGGGGAFLLVCRQFNVTGTPTYSANAGTGGFGSGTGAAGTAGTAGNTTPYVVIVP